METKDLVLDEETKEKLKKAGMLGFSVEAPFKYVPKFFRENKIPKNLWPVFTLKSKSGIEIAEAEDSMGFIDMDSEKRKYVVESGKQRLDTLRKGILEVKNFICEDGSIINYPEGAKKPDPDKVIKFFKASLQVELQNAINERDELTSEELLGLE